MTVTQEDISLVHQKHLVTYVKVQLLTKEFNNAGIIYGQLISGNISIEAGDEIKRSANITIKTDQRYINTPSQDIQISIERDVPFNYFVKLYCGIEDNNTLTVHWYNQGIFIINQSDYNFDAGTSTLSMSLVDLMSDLNGDRCGTFHAYTSLVKNEQRIDTVIGEVLELAGFEMYTLEPITEDYTVYNPTVSQFIAEPDKKMIEKKYMIPYDINFSAGVTAYEIIEKLVHLYPYYVMGFDVNGVFFCRKTLFDEDSSYVILSNSDLDGLVISEDASVSWNNVKNHIEVWGKDGAYYGEAEDDVPGSPFQVKSTRLVRLVAKDNKYGIDTNSICDRYWNTELANAHDKVEASTQAKIAALMAKEELTEAEENQLTNLQASLDGIEYERSLNIRRKGNDLAEDWAKKLLNDYTRLEDSLTLQTIWLPMINDADFKISYRSKNDNKVKTYIVKSVSHDPGQGTTTLNAIRFYDEQSSGNWSQLATPVITAESTGSVAIITVTPVQFAESYNLYIDRKFAGVSVSNVITYVFPDSKKGTHYVSVTASAPYYRDSEFSNEYPVTITAPANVLVTNNAIEIVTNTNDTIIIGT